MRSPFLITFVLFVCISSAYGFGYIFNRFRPEANSLGEYGARGVASQVESLTPRQRLVEALLGEEMLEEEVCKGRRCTSNEHCCPDHVCVDLDGVSSGACISVATSRLSVDCASDVDCSDGFLCDAGSCVQGSDRKGYNEACVMSSGCDIENGLCCQVIRRHRQAPRKMCAYFKNPLSCIGHMDSEVKRSRNNQ